MGRMWTKQSLSLALLLALGVGLSAPSAWATRGASRDISDASDCPSPDGKVGIPVEKLNRDWASMFLWYPTERTWRKCQVQLANNQVLERKFKGYRAKVKQVGAQYKLKFCDDDTCSGW